MKDQLVLELKRYHVLQLFLLQSSIVNIELAQNLIELCWQAFAKISWLLLMGLLYFGIGRLSFSKLSEA